MPYKVKAEGGGYEVTSPHHPKGFSKKPKSKAGAIAQLRAIIVSRKRQGKPVE